MNVYVKGEPMIGSRVRGYCFACAIFVLSCGTISMVSAQTGPREIVQPATGRSLPPIHIIISGLRQEWTNPGPEFSQNTVSYGIQIAARPNFTIRGNINQIVVDGDGLRSVGGASDLQVGGQYVMYAGNSRVIIDLAVNLPTGRTDLPDAAFATASRMALSQFDFRQPYFGQGSVIAPSIGLIQTLGQHFVYSIGAAYRLKGDYQPFKSLTEKYDWGDEIVFTAGADWRVLPAIQILGDVSVTSYSADSFGAADVYDAGDRWSGKLQINIQLGRHDAGVSTQFRQIDTNKRIFLTALVDEPTTSFPNLVHLSGYFVVRFNSLLGVYLETGVTGYGESLDQSDLTIYSATVKPTISLSSKISLPLHFKYHYGDLTGLEAGAALSIIL